MMWATNLSRFIFFGSILWVSVCGDFLGRKTDDTKFAYGCLAKGVVDVKCPANEKINISQVLYGAEPEDCGEVFSKNNDCQQYSESRTAAAQASCDGEETCQVAIEPLNSDIIENEDIIPVQNGCPVDGEYHQVVYVNYMVVKYKCQAFLFCTDIKEMQVKKLNVRTEGYPRTVTTNPTCECAFGSGGDDTYIAMIIQCNGTVMLSVDETVENPKDSTELITVNNRYFCDNRFLPDVLYVGQDRARMLTVSVVAENSSEHSALSFTPLISRSVYHETGIGLKRAPDVKTVVSCKKGSFYLPLTVSLILQIALPVMVVLIIALIVVYCCIKKRRKKAREWRRKHISLRNNANGSHHESSSAAKPLTSPLGSYASSTPSSIRRKPDGKLDSESDEDLAQTAARLHRQNTQRRAEEIKKRDEYYGNGEGGVANGPHSRMPQTYAQQYYEEAIQREQERELTAYRDGERKCRSIGNLPRCGAADVNDSPSASLLPRARSASQSRTNARHANSRSTLPPPYPYHMNVSSRNNINRDNDDPDLTFDDPRDGDRSRDISPVRNMVDQAAPRSPLYGEQISHSIGNLRQPSSAHARPIHRTKSASQSRTSLRSMKRRAPQPPTHLPVKNTAPRSGPGTPVHSRGSTPTAAAKYSKNPKTNHKYFNPYAVRLPQNKPKLKTAGVGLGGEGDNTGGGGVVMSHDLPKCEHRRYSDSGSLDESDHGGDDINQMGVMGDFDGDMMDDDDQW